MSYEMNRRTWLSRILGAAIACSGFGPRTGKPVVIKAKAIRRYECARQLVSTGGGPWFGDVPDNFRGSLIWNVPNRYGVTVRVYHIPREWCREIPGAGW